jgi:hypothetical protein
MPGFSPIAILRAHGASEFGNAPLVIGMARSRMLPCLALASAKMLFRACLCSS